MTNFILGVFEITIGMSLFIALLLIGLKLFGGKFTAKCRYIIWALVMLRLAIPFSFGLLPTLIEIPIDTELVQSEDISSVLSENTDSVTSVQPSDPGNIAVTPTVPSTPVFPNVDHVNPDNTPIFPGDQAEPVIPSEPVIETPTEQPVSLRQILDIVGIVYLTGAAVFLVWSLVSYFIYTRKILHSAKTADERTQKIFSTICKKYGIKKQPTLLVASGIHSPAAFGIFRRKIVLPDIAFTENGLVGTLAHEVTHCKRGDLYMKLVELIACSLNWFNPLVHIAAFQCEMEMELSCDEKVLSGSSDAARAAYGEVMLDIIRRCRRSRGALTTHFNPKKSAVTARFKNILYGSGKRRGRILIGVCLVLCVLAGAFVACQTGDDLPDDIGYAEGIYIKDKAGADMILIDGTSPCTFWGADGVVIEDLTVGDHIRIGVIEFLDSSPMQAEVYSIEKLSDGTIDDIDPAVLDSLRELGWIDETEQNQAQLKEILITDDKLGQNSYMEYVHGYKLTQNGKYIISRYNACYPNSIPITEMWRYGILDRDGNEIIPCICTEIIEDKNGTIYIVGEKGIYTGDAFVFISDEQASEIPAIADNSMYYIDGKYPAMGYGDSNGNPLTDNVYSYCSPVNENGEAIVVKDRKTYIITLPTDRPKLPGYDVPQFASTSEEFGSEEIEKLVFTPRDAAGVVLYHRFTASNTYIFLCSVYDLDIYGSRIDAPPKRFSAYYTADFGKTIGIVDIKLPEDIEYDSVVPEAFGPGGGSMELQIILRLTKGNESFCVSFDNFSYSGDNFLSFEYRGTITEDVVESYKQMSIGTALEQIPVEPDPFNPDAYAALIPNSSADRLFWHRIAGTDDYLYFCAIRTINSTMTRYTDDPPKDFAIYYQQYDQNFFSVIDEPIPEEYPYDSIVPVLAITGEECISMRCILQLTDGDRTYYISYQAFEGIDQVYHPVSDDEIKALANMYPEIFGVIEENIKWTQYSETRTGEDGNIYQISFDLPAEWTYGSGGIFEDANGNKRIGSRYIAVDISKEDFVSSLEEMAEQYNVDLDSPLTGTSDSGIAYMGYCFEGEREIPGDITGRYLYRFTYSDSISMHMDVWKRNAYDDDSFYEQYVLPIIQSVTIRETGDYVDTITDIADWEKLPWSESWERWGSKPASNAYNFIYNLVSGESEIPEYNGLGITEYSISVVEDEGSGIGTTLSFTFKVAGLSLPSTLIPAIYTWTLYDGMGLFVYHEDKPTNQEEYTAYENRMRGLHRFEGNSAVEAVDTYLSWMPYIYEVSPYGEWDPENYHLPYNYICAHYGKNLEISFSELQNLMAEKFGIAVERPEKSGLLSRCEYDKERDTVHYADTRGYTAVHRFSDVREEDGITYVSVMLFADKHYLIPSHTIQYKIGEGNVFLGCEIIREGNYEPRELS